MPAITPIISTPDLPRLRAFYEGLLGAKEFQRYPGQGDIFLLGLRIGDADLGLVAEAQTGTGRDGQRIALSVAVDDVDGLLDTVRRLGGTILAPPTDMPWGQRVGHVFDPDGTMVNLTQDL